MQIIFITKTQYSKGFDDKEVSNFFAIFYSPNDSPFI